MSEEQWGPKYDYLRHTRSLYHNDDYLEFLVHKVWQLHNPCNIIDFGCGYGFLGLKLLPLLPQGSTYTGVDLSSQLLERARRLFAPLPYSAQFIRASATAVPLPDNTFDLAVCHALLMHLPRPQQALAEMIRLTRDKGRVIACESNWNGVNALHHVDEVEKTATTDLGFLQQLFERDRQTTGRDGNIGVKLPVMMHKAGLKNVDARISDKAVCFFPPVDNDEKEALYQSLSRDIGPPLDEEKIAAMTARFLGRGFSPAEATDQIEREKHRIENWLDQGRACHVVMPAVMMFSYGQVSKEEA
ncbi:MAG: methyltransferase domain-containing protein [Candidatus Latescibacteria bacterium]|nr:methyltransferase domain-containing protein [Candidatus Latescibacterota bacterium]